VKLVAITEGRAGASLISKNGLWKARVYKTKAIDETGAGDAFVAGVVAGMISSKSMEVCLKMGLANGASVVSDFGAKNGLLRKTEMSKRLKKNVEVIEEICV